MIKRLKSRAWGNAILSIFIIASACGVAFIGATDPKTVDVPDETTSDSFTFALPTVVIDPGHGGIDCGAVGVNGILEKDVNLKLSEYLCAEFKNAGYEVIMTRTEDIMLVDDKSEHTTKKSSDLTARTRIAEGGQLFISIHMNKFAEEKYSGAQVYYSVNDDRSVRLAQMLQAGIIASLQPQNNREIKSGAGLYLLDRVKCPAVIVECGFISNREEAERLASDEYLKELAFEIFSAADDFVIECMENGT